MFIASHRGELEVLSQLLVMGADTEIFCGSWERTALMDAAAGGRADVVKVLLEGGARVNTQHVDGATALYWAANGNHVEVIKLLVEGGADPNLFGTRWGSPLCAAVSSDAIDAVEFLVWHGADVEARCTWWNLTALHMAVSANKMDMVRVLVERGPADIEAMDAGGRQALHLAAHNGNIEMLRYLKAAGSWLDVPDKSGRTALHYAVQANRSAAVGELLSGRACDVNVRTPDGTTPLHMAAASGFVEVAELLIDAGADVNAVRWTESGEEESVLRVAVLADRPDLVRLLLKAGAEVEASGNLLLEAARRNCRGAVEVLLKARAWPEEVDAAVRELVNAAADL